MCSGSAAGQRAFNTEGNPHNPLSGELHGFVIGFFLRSLFCRWGLLFILVTGDMSLVFIDCVYVSYITYLSIVPYVIRICQHCKQLLL